MYRKDEMNEKMRIMQGGGETPPLTLSPEAAAPRGLGRLQRSQHHLEACRDRLRLVAVLRLVVAQVGQRQQAHGLAHGAVRGGVPQMSYTDLSVG